MNASRKEMLDQVVITYSLKHLPCSKPDCVICLTAKGHGPYWYAHFTLEGREKNVFLGRSFKPMDLTQILLGDIAKGIKASNVNKEEDVATYEKAQLRTEWVKAHGRTRATKAQAVATPLRVDQVGKINRPKAHQPPSAKPIPPSKLDFEQDIRLLKGAAKSENLKFVYRKLIKKYHPDQYDSCALLDEWMSQINGMYQALTP